MQKIFHYADRFGYPSLEVVTKEQTLAAVWMTKNKFRARLSELSVPTLIIAGEQDRLAAFEKSKELKKLIHNSTLVSYPNTAHGLMFQYPFEVATAILEFVSK